MDLKNIERGIAAGLEAKSDDDLQARLRDQASRARTPETFHDAWEALFADDLVTLPKKEGAR